MTQLLVLREHIQKFYQKNSPFFNSLFRFVLGFVIFSSINRIIGYHPELNQIYVEAFLAVLSAFMPGGVLLFASAAFACVHIFYVSRILAFVVCLLFIIFYFAYLKFVPKHAYAILAIPVAFPLNIAYGVPIFLGIIMTPVAVIPITCGIGIYYLLQAVTVVVSSSADTGTNLYHAVMQQFLHSEEMYVMIVVFSVVSMIVYILRTREWNYAFEIAIFAGAVSNAVLLLIVKYLLDINIHVLSIVVGSILSGILVWLIQFMRLALNYTSVEHLQFEDEEYYYYVRAVPKINLAAPSKSVKRINVRRFSEQMQGIKHEENEQRE